MLTLLLSLLGLTHGFGQQVEATLSQDFTSVGQPVQLNVAVVGARGAQVPQSLQIDGLDARFAGKSEQMEMQFGSGGYRRTVTGNYTYLIVPLREGTFTLPAVPVEIDGKVFKTKPLTLRVSAGQGGSIPVLPAIPTQPGQQGNPSAQNPSRGSSQPEPAEGKSVFGELLVPKTTAYAGEVVPVEIRFFFDARYQVRLQDRPGFSGNGFTVLDLSKPIERRQEIDGITYNVVSFQTAITPAKSGLLEIPGATLESQIQSPSTQRRRDDFFGGLFGQMMETRPVTITTDPVELEVKPLPREGRPENFGGAIGQFSLSATAVPEKAASGDPVSLKVAVAGRGNFDAMSAPELIETDGWRTYPPGEDFVPSPSDPIGFNGEKRYEYMLLAPEDQTATPVAEFSFFDPAVEKYVTLKTAPVPVVAQGGAAPATTPAAVASSPPTSSPSPAGPESSPEESALVKNFVPSTFEPLLMRKWVWAVNGVLAGVWGLIFLVSMGRKWAQSPRAREAAALRETRRLLKTMDDPGIDSDRFFRLAEEFVRARLTAPGSVDSGLEPRSHLEQLSLAPEIRLAVEDILDRHDAARYSTVTVPLDADERQKILNHLKTFDVELQK